MGKKDETFKFDWEIALDEAGCAAFKDLSDGGDGLKKSESVKVAQTLYTLHLADQRNKEEIAIKKRDNTIKMCETIIDGTGKLALAAATGVGIGFGIKNMNKITALDESYKVVSNRVFQWNLNQIIKPAMSAALQLVRF